MKIGHFAQALCSNAKTGIGWYTYNIINELSMMDNIESELYAFDLLNRNHSKEALALLFESSAASNKITYKTNQLVLNGLYSRFPQIYSKISFDTLFNSKVDLHHAHNYFLPYKLKTPSIVTIYDMVYKLYPETMAQANLDLLQAVVPRSVNECSKILTISENSKQEICDLLNIPKEKISIAYPAFDERIYKIVDPSISNPLICSLGITKPYILYLGTLEPRKNIETIIKAYAQLPELHKDFDLVLAGGNGWKSESIYTTIETYHLKEHVHFTGYISQETQVALYNQAECFVFPSLYEGFGMPALEAMACGAPVITSNTSSLPEVVGDAGIKVNPMSADELSSAIHSVINNTSLKQEMKLKNKDQIQKFSWKKAADQVYDVYSSLL